MSEGTERILSRIGPGRTLFAPKHLRGARAAMEAI